MISPETPKFSYEQMTSPENRPGVERVNHQMVDALTKYLPARFDSIYSQTARFGERQAEALVVNSREELPKEIELIERHRGEIPLTKAERTILESYWGMAGEIQRQARIDELRREAEYLGKRADQTEGGTVDAARAELSRDVLESAKWENQSLRTIYSLRESGSGRAFLRAYWEGLNQISRPFKHQERRGEKLKDGLLGVCGTIDSFEGLGFEVYLADPEQDMEGIDLIGVMGNTMVILQVKSHFGEKFSIDAQEVKQYDYSQKETKGEQILQQQRNRLLTGKERYGKLFGQLGIDCQVIPMWVEVTVNPHERRGQDPTTGKIDLPSGFRESKFAGQVYSSVPGGRHES